MKHTVTITHEVEAEAWDLAVEAVLREPFAHIATCKVKAPRRRLVHVSPGAIHLSLEQLKEESHAREVPRAGP